MANGIFLSFSIGGQFFIQITSNACRYDNNLIQTVKAFSIPFTYTKNNILSSITTKHNTSHNISIHLRHIDLNVETHTGEIHKRTLHLAWFMSRTLLSTNTTCRHLFIAPFYIIHARTICGLTIHYHYDSYSTLL